MEKYKFNGKIPENILMAGGWYGKSLNFFSSYNGKYNICEIIINHRMINRIFLKQFEYTCRNLFKLSTISASIDETKNNNITRSNKTFVDNTINQAKTEIQLYLDRAGALLKAHDVGGNRVSSEATPVAVPVTSLSVMQFIEMMLMADKFFTLNDALLRSEKIDPKEKFKIDSEVRSIVQNVIHLIAERFKHLIKLASVEHYI